jgi:AraC family transcriptional regulator of adaptative response / DNA-3-methyladenine glycosylase II
MLLLLPITFNLEFIMNIQDYQQARLSRDPRFDGVFFTAVKTTGIFCRPVCPATPPKEHNVEYFETASEALVSGYRPCLRCRPESAPFSPAWSGTETTV